MMIAAVSQPDAFNYIEALQLLIVAIGVTKIVEGLGWMLEHRQTCTTYWVHTLGATLIGLLQLQYAWTSFYDFSVAEWSFGDFLLECSTPVIYLFVADLLFPATPQKDCSFVETYRVHVRLIAVLVMIAQVVNSILDFRFHPDEAHHLSQHLVRGGVIVVLGGLLLPFPHYKRVHEIVFVLLFIALLAFCLFLTPTIHVQAR